MRVITFALLAVGILSCQDDTEPKITSPDGLMSGYSNTAFWESDAYLGRNAENDTLLLVGGDAGVLIVRLKFDGTGTYTLTNRQAMYHTTLGGDVLMSNYLIPPDTTAILTVSAYDPQKKEVSGTFELLLKKQWSYVESDPDTLLITDGRFRGTIQD